MVEFLYYVVNSCDKLLRFFPFHWSKTVPFVAGNNLELVTLSHLRIVIESQLELVTSSFGGYVAIGHEQVSSQ